jgi:SAM-dependent methyltransferase
VEVVPGTAEVLPFADGDIDAAVAGQAYHWFEPDRANAELARVIRPGGTVAAIWNERDESQDWVSAYSRVVEGDRGPSATGGQGGSRRMAFGDLFTPVELAVYHHSAPSSPDDLVALLRSRSYYLTATPQRRAELDGEVRELARTHPDLAGRTEFLLPYVTRVFRAVRR